MPIDKSDGRPKSRAGGFEHIGVFRKPALFEGEQDNYHQLLREISSAVRPRDICEQIFVGDCAYHIIEVLRLRRVEVELIKISEYKGLSEVLTPIVGRVQAETLAKGWAARQPEVVKHVKKVLRSSGLGTDSIRAQAFFIKLKEIECIKHLGEVAETRRDATLREIDRHRHTLGQDLRRVAQQLEDEQLRVIESVPISVDRSDEG
jgi:hypothetical protein